MRKLINRRTFLAATRDCTMPFEEINRVSDIQAAKYAVTIGIGSGIESSPYWAIADKRWCGTFALKVVDTVNNIQT